MMWQKLILVLCAKSNPDVTPTVCFCGIYVHTLSTEAQSTTYFRSVNPSVFPLAEGMLSII